MKGWLESEGSGLEKHTPPVTFDPTHSVQSSIPHGIHEVWVGSAHVPCGQGVQEREPVTAWSNGRVSTVCINDNLCVHMYKHTLPNMDVKLHSEQIPLLYTRGGVHSKQNSPSFDTTWRR